jgi:nucleoid-associated protein YgaU
MSQKSTHNSKRRPPGDNAQSGQQDADWGFDADEADPAVEKKLAVALVVCLLAGFGFVFYQKFRLLRSDDAQQASAETQAEQGEQITGGDAATDPENQPIALGSAASQGQASPDASATSVQQVDSPFYERRASTASPSNAAGADDDNDDDDGDDDGDGWTLAQTEVSKHASAGIRSGGLPPLPESGPSDGFDPFAHEEDGMASGPARAAEGPSPGGGALSEPPIMVWDEPAGVPAPVQSEPEPENQSGLEFPPETAPATTDTQPAPGPGTLPQIAPHPPRRNRTTQPDPFVFDTESSDPAPQSETGTPSGTNRQPGEEPQMLIFGDPEETSAASDKEQVGMAIEPLPVRSEPQSVEALDADAAAAKSPAASGFDPFVGPAARDESAAAITGGPSPASQSSPPRPRTNDAAADADDPFPPADPPSPAQTPPSPATTASPADDPQSADDPFTFPSPASEPSGAIERPADRRPSAEKPTFEPFPAAASPAPASERTPAPTWPEGTSSRSRQASEDPAPFPSSDPQATHELAPLPTRPPHATTFESPEVDSLEIEPRPVLADPSQAPPSGAAPNPFAFDAGASRPVLNSPHDAQRVVGEREVTVTPSDSFWSISEREYGSTRYFTALARYNRDRVAKPEQLQSGMKILIPPPEVLEDRFPELFRRAAQGSATISPMSGTSSAAPAEPGLFLDEMQRPFYRVGEKDTLSSIARQHLGRESRWTEIYDLNKSRLKSPSSLTIGMELKLPPDADTLRVSPAGGFDR